MSLHNESPGLSDAWRAASHSQRAIGVSVAATVIGTPLVALGGVIGASVNGAKIRKDRVELKQQKLQIATMQGELAGLQARTSGNGSLP